MVNQPCCQDKLGELSEMDLTYQISLYEALCHLVYVIFIKLDTRSSKSSYDSERELFDFKGPWCEVSSKMNSGVRRRSLKERRDPSRRPAARAFTVLIRSPISRAYT